MLASRKKIIINCWVLRNKNLDGIGYFTVNTISRLIKNHPEIDFLVLVDKKFTEPYFDFENVTKHYIFPALRHPLLYVFYMEFIAPFFYKKHKPDLVIAPDGIISLNTSVKQLCIIHDIHFVHYPSFIKFSNKIYYNFFFKKFCKKATAIATVSQFCKNDIATTFSINREKVSVVYNGINTNLQPPNLQQQNATKDKWTNSKDYFFYIGGLHPRKNLVRLLQAFDLFKSNTKSDIKLVIAGGVLWDGDEITEQHDRCSCKNDILFTGRLTEDELNLLFGSSNALTLVSIFEGFGIPLVEAMELQIPILTSNVTAMPEVVGDAAYLVNPLDINDIAKGMKLIIEDCDLADDLVKKGNEQKKKFSWDNSSKSLWEVIEKILN
jgi:glycosyltransferase involved in cell wall biosynthesis